MEDLGNDFTDGMALHAAKLIWDNLAESVNGEPGEDKIKAQERRRTGRTERKYSSGWLCGENSGCG